jgi:hypothetical protein
MTSSNSTKKDESVLGPPALFEGEDREAYDRLYTAICNQEKPTDIFGEIYVRDLVDLTWQILRYRRVMVGLEGVTAESFGDKLDLAWRIDGMTALAERRRAAIGREHQLHREMREATQQLQNDKSRVIENKVGEIAK